MIDYCDVMVIELQFNKVVFMVFGDGEHIVEFCFVDVVGMVEVIKLVMFWIGVELILTVMLTVMVTLLLDVLLTFTLVLMVTFGNRDMLCCNVFGKFGTIRVLKLVLFVFCGARFTFMCGSSGWASAMLIVFGLVVCKFKRMMLGIGCVMCHVGWMVMLIVKLSKSTAKVLCCSKFKWLMLRFMIVVGRYDMMCTFTLW